MHYFDSQGQIVSAHDITGSLSNTKQNLKSEYYLHSVKPIWSYIRSVEHTQQITHHSTHVTLHFDAYHSHSAHYHPHRRTPISLNAYNPHLTHITLTHRIQPSLSTYHPHSAHNTHLSTPAPNFPPSVHVPLWNVHPVNDAVLCHYRIVSMSRAQRDWRLRCDRLRCPLGEGNLLL